LHPLVCGAFNADFDGDQMAVHVPLSEEAQLEARTLMLASNNVLHLASGEPIIVPSQDVILGLYYMTRDMINQKGEGMIFANAIEALNAHESGTASLHAKIKLRIQDYKKVDGKYQPTAKRIVDTTVGRAIFSRILPAGLSFDLINKAISKKVVSNLIHVCYQTQELKDTVVFADQMMYMGFQYSTKSGISFCSNDMTIPDSKAGMMMAIFESYPHCLQNLQNRFRPSLLLQQFQKFVTKYQSPCLSVQA
jgi:DNA-directed RNA polymerase subunit beta'